MGTEHRLELREDNGGLRYFLDGRPVHAGNLLEMLLRAGEWLAVRFEWPVEDELPTLQLGLGETEETVTFHLPEGARLRWRE